MFLLLVTAAFLGLSVRLFAVQVKDHDALRARREKQRLGLVDVRSPRGAIRDARGEILAVSVPVSSIYAVPAQIADPAALGRALGFDVASKLKPGREFVWLKRRATEEDVARVAAWPGVGVRTEHLRRFPHGSVLAHVLGMTNVDDQGLEGLERVLEPVLAGESERGAIVVDGRRGKLSYPESEFGAADVELTIPLAFQYVVEEALDAAVERFHPKWAAVVAMDPRTGAVLALANRPAFDPNAPITDPKAHQNMAIIAPYEPGSTLKPFLIAAALEEKLLTPKTTLFCENGEWKHGSRRLHDHESYGTLTVKDIIAKSSNVGAAKIGALVLGRARMKKWVEAFGFGEKTGVEFPLEHPGSVAPRGWNEFTLTSIPIGHEIAVTMLQLARAMSAIVNGGRLVRPYVVRRLVSPGGDELWAARLVEERMVLSPRVCDQMREILVEVVKNGTGKNAAVEGVLVGGKTGTTQKVDPATGRYTSQRHIASFVGFAPAEDPRVCVAVVLDEPQGAYYGGTVAAPVFAEIVRRGLPHLK
ncbi:MAG: penicillin-binding protein 2 [Planctomycetes bacterium]|nr:penicillin-binding protein 2 [Planctomycetota bacterium]